MKMEFYSLLWIIPFVGIILSMSFLPILTPKFWHKVAAWVPLFWSSLFLGAVGYFFSPSDVVFSLLDPLLDHYLPFIALIAALYITSGGIYINLKEVHSPLVNTGFLFLGSLLSGWIGTTGAATLLIRPFLRNNRNRKNKTHLAIFFIFLVGNIGGGATPLGDPPLFMGYLEGVDFFWFLKNLYPHLFFTITGLCIVFYLWDSYFFKKEPKKLIEAYDHEGGGEFVIKGAKNILLLIAILVVVVVCEFEGSFKFLNVKCEYSALLRSFLLFLIAWISLKVTSKEVCDKNAFSFEPIKEVAELFVGIFITVTPVIAILHQARAGALKFLFDWLSPAGEIVPEKCFWLSGILSSVLDNAPTFLIFFHLASGNAAELMTAKSHLLIAISISTVFMGALTYIGNAPNLMIRSIAVNYGVKMPSFLGYIGWSVGILVPIFIILSYFL